MIGINKLPGYFFNIRCAIMSLFYHRDKKIVVFDSWFGDKFADNPRFLYQYLSETKDEHNLTHVVWVTRNGNVCRELNNMGYECYMLDSEASKELQKRAGYLICNNSASSSKTVHGEFLTEYNYGAIKINLWHGSGALKNVNMASNEYNDKVHKHPLFYSIKNYIYTNSSIYRKFFVGQGGWGDCYYLTTSLSEKAKFQKFFLLPDKNLIISNYPRNIVNFPYLNSEINVINIMKGFKYTVLYLPTFRDKNSDFDFRVVADSLGDVLEEKNILLIQKAHSATLNGKVSCDTITNNILNLNSNFDINILTPIVTCVMTDYSSIFADALYNYKPVILYVSDYDEYMNGERGFAKDAEYLLSAGKKITNIEELKDCLRNFEKFINNKPPCYDEIRSRIWERDKTMDEIWSDLIEATK